MEVYDVHVGEWRALCAQHTWLANNIWWPIHAVVTCREQGYLTGEAQILQNTIEMHVLANHLVCNGAEYSLDSCFTDSLYLNCDSTKVAGVKCYTKIGNFNLFITRVEHDLNLLFA